MMGDCLKGDPRKRRMGKKCNRQKVLEIADRERTS